MHLDLRMHFELIAHIFYHEDTFKMTKMASSFIQDPVDEEAALIQ